MGGSKELLIELNNSTKPLKTERTTIKEAVTSETTTTEIMEMILMKFFFLVENRYRLAIKSGKFTND